MLGAFSRRRALIMLAALPAPILAACGGAPASPTAAPTTAPVATKPAATTAATAASPVATTAPTAAATPAATTAAVATKPAATTAPVATTPVATTAAVTKPAATGGTLIISSLAAKLSATLHPYPDNSSYTSSHTDVATLIWSGGLLEFDANTLEYKPDMAREYRVSPDGKTFTFTLRDDLKWSDGTPITVDDFLYAYEQASNPENDYVGLDDVQRIASFTAPDPKTIVVALKEVYARDVATGVANSIAPVPTKVWKGKPWNDPTGNPEILNPSVVIGPYQVKEFKVAEQATYEPLTTHYAGRPSLEQIVWKPTPQPTVGFELLKSGQTNWAYNLPPAQLPEAEKNPDLNVLKWTAANGTYRVLEFNLTRPFLADKKVREAIARSLSRQDMIQVAEGGLGTPMFSFINPANTKWYNPNVEKYDFDMTRAKSLLQEAGYTLDGGVLKGKDGQPIKLVVPYPTSSAPRGKIATYMQQQLKQLGIELEVRGLDFNAYVDTVSKQKDYDLSLAAYGGGSIDPDLGPKAQLISTGQQNITGFKNEQVDTLFNQGAVEQDATKRKAIYDQLQKIVTDDLPVYYQYSVLSFTAFSKKVSGPTPNKLDRVEYNRAFMRWSVAK